MPLSTIEQLLSELDAEVAGLKTVLASKDSEIESLKSQLEAATTELASSAQLVAGLRADVLSSAKPSNKRHNPMLDLCESSPDEAVAPAPSRFQKRQRHAALPTSPGRIVIDDLAPKKWEWSDEFDSEKDMADVPRPQRAKKVQQKIEWVICKAK